MSEKEYKIKCENLFKKNTVLLNQQKIDAEQIRALQKQNGELTDELTLTNNECKDMREELKQRIRENQELCEQIEKMKCCENCAFFKDKTYDICHRIKKLGTRKCAFYKMM